MVLLDKGEEVTLTCYQYNNSSHIHGLIDYSTAPYFHNDSANIFATLLTATVPN